MSRAPSTFRQRDVTRAIRAAVAAGVDIARVEVTRDGIIRILFQTRSLPSEQSVPNEWDSVP